jgi:uncharacterized membrane protein YfcA
MMGYEIWELAVIAGIYLVAGVVKGGIGLGLPTVSIGLMAAWMPVEQAAGILILPVILTNIWQAFFGTALKLVIYRIWKLQVALVIGSVISALLIAGVDTDVAAGLLGAMLVIFAALGLSGAQFRVPVRSEATLGPVMGLATGLISGATAIFVIPVVPYLQSLDFSKGRPGREDDPTDPTRATDETMMKDALIQSLGVTVLVASIGLGLGLGARGELPPSVIAPGLIGTATALVGMVSGRAIRNRMSLEIFRRWVLVGLVGLGIVMVARAVA